MNHNYEDIRSRIAEPPRWFDEHAVPRYCEFAPDAVADIYADEAALVLIACQNCGTRFHVAFSSDRATWMIYQYRQFEEAGRYDHEWEAFAKHLSKHPLADAIQNKTLHYGDPPNVGCCPAGPTMNCDDLRVIEYWRRDQSFDWQRDSSFEIPLGDANYVE